MTIGCEIRGTYPPPKANTKTYRLISLAGAALAATLFVVPVRAQVVISNGQNVIDFGCVGEDFKVFSNFHLLNKGSATVKVKSINVPCDCSEVWISDSTLRAGDSARVRLTFDTKNLYGRTLRSFKIYTSDSRAPVIEYIYRSVVGQWLFGFRPDPPSLFFLPAVKTKRLAFGNPTLEQVKMRIVDQADTTYTIRVLSDKAVKGGKVEIEVSPKDGLRAGTYLSSFRVELQPADGRDPILCSVPIKIVRY